MNILPPKRQPFITGAESSEWQKKLELHRHQVSSAEACRISGFECTPKACTMGDRLCNKADYSALTPNPSPTIRRLPKTA
ncbi:MAG TPA: hypothetical protein PLQ56_05425, partial [Aggregatilineales bacterium]|nr:hypothetical protein [Aggregatilineales bacterium]